MPALLSFRLLLSMLAAGGLAACAGTAPSSPVTVAPEQPTTIALISRTSPMLVVGNARAEAEAQPGDGRVHKTVDDPALQALLDTFAQDGTFDASIPTAPPNANQLLMLEHGDRRWFWATTGANDARTAAFVRARSYFLQLFNHARAYQAADDAGARELQDSARRARELEIERRRRSGTSGAGRQP